MSSSTTKIKGPRGIITIRAADMPTDPEPAVPPPVAPPEPTPDPEPTAAPVPYQFRGGLPPAFSASLAAIGELARLRGPVALAEILAAVAALDAELAVQRRRLAGPEARAALEVVRDLIGRRSIYAARAVAIAEALGVARPELAEIPPIPALALVWAASDRGDVAAAVEGRVRTAAAALSEAEAELARARSLIAHPTHYAALASSPGWAPDVRLGRLDSALAEHSRASAELAEAKGQAAELADLVGAEMRAAVEAAGGRDAAVEAVAAAMALSAVAPRPDPELAEIDEQLRKLIGFGDRVEGLKTRRAEILDRAEASRHDRANRRMALAGELVDAVIAGSVRARAEIEGALASSPDVAPELLAAVRASSPDRLVVAALVV